MIRHTIVRDKSYEIIVQLSETKLHAQPRSLRPRNLRHMIELLIHRSGPAHIDIGSTLFIPRAGFAMHNFSLTHGSMKLKVVHASKSCAVCYFHDSRKIFTWSPASWRRWCAAAGSVVAVVVVVSTPDVQTVVWSLREARQCKYPQVRGCFIRRIQRNICTTDGTMSVL